MEVMLEIYKTLNILGMEWRRKDGVNLPEIGPPPPGAYPEDVEIALAQWISQGGTAPQMGKKAPSKKDIAAQDKVAQGLYLVETRARYGDVMAGFIPSSASQFVLKRLRCEWIFSSTELTRKII